MNCGDFLIIPLPSLKEQYIRVLQNAWRRRSDEWLKQAEAETKAMLAELAARP